MSFGEDERANKYPPKNSQLKKKKSEQEKPRRRAQWKQNNKSVIESPKQEVIEQPPKVMRRDSARCRQEINDSRRKMKQDVKNQKGNKNNFDVVFVGVGESEPYVPTIQEKKLTERPIKAPEQLPISTNDTPDIKQKQPVKRAGWNKNQKSEVKPVRDISEERRKWKRPAPIPKDEKKQPEKFEVVDIPQDEEEKESAKIMENANNNEQCLEQRQREDMQNYHSDQNFINQLDKDHFQFERMINDMKSNLFFDSPAEDSTELESQNENDEYVTESEDVENELVASEPKLKNLPSITKDDEEDRDDFEYSEAEKADDVAEEQTNIKEQAIMKNATFGGNITEVMDPSNKKIIGDKIDDDLGKYNSTDRIKLYLEEEIGQELLSKAHPILKEFGDDILYENNIPLVVDKLQGILSENEVVKYLHFFATWIFFENEQERIKERKNNKGKKEEKPAQIDFNAATFKSAAQDAEEDNIFKKLPEGKEPFDMTATASFGI